MNIGKRQAAGRGAALVYTAVVLFMLMSFVTLAVDFSMMATAKAQLQNAADAGAIAGARSLNGNAYGNASAATAMERIIAQGNRVLAVTIQSSEVSVRHGANHYDPGTQKFTPQFPPKGGDN